MMVTGKTNCRFPKESNCLTLGTKTKFDQKYLIREYINLNVSFIFWQMFVGENILISHSSLSFVGSTLTNPCALA